MLSRDPGREPESDQPVQQLLRIDDFKSLVLAFIGSPEFQIKSKQSVSPIPVLPRLDIEYTATNDQLARLLERVRQSWTHLGEVRPHNSVLTSDQFLPKNIEKSEGEF